MPIYVYECPDCGAIEELRIPVSDRDQPWLCIQCGAELVRSMTTAAFMFATGGTKGIINGRVVDGDWEN